MTTLDDATLTALIPSLRRFARALAGQADTADDLVQAALERALSTRATCATPMPCKRGCFSSSTAN